METTETTRDHNTLYEIEDLRCERMPETAEKQVSHKKLLKVIILGDTGKFNQSMCNERAVTTAR